MAMGRFAKRNDIRELDKAENPFDLRRQHFADRQQYHDRILIPRFSLRAPSIDGKQVFNVDSLRIILTFHVS
ncbi:hypothetical protein PG989_000284 [Apiospora arundinis]